MRMTKFNLFIAFFIIIIIIIIIITIIIIQVLHILTEKLQSLGTISFSVPGNQPEKNLLQSQLDIGILI